METQPLNLAGSHQAFLGQWGLWSNLSNSRAGSRYQRSPAVVHLASMVTEVLKASSAMPPFAFSSPAKNEKLTMVSTNNKAGNEVAAKAQ